MCPNAKQKPMPCSSSGAGPSGPKLALQGLGSRVQGLGVRVEGTGFKVQRLGLRG